MLWLTKTFPFGAHWAADQDRFVTMMMSLAANGTGDYRKVLMVTLDGEPFKTEHVYLLLPEACKHLFPGYEKATAPAAVTSLLVGDQIEFERQFQPNSAV